MICHELLAAVVIATSANVLATNKLLEQQIRSEGGEKAKNFDLCSRVFDVSNATIIKTSDSLKNGARYLSNVQVNSREACERSCCSTDSCNVAILEEKAPATGGDCFLFDCGSLDDFKCVFAVHTNYVALGMMANRGDLEKTRIHEQAKHEMDLKILKTPSGQQDDVAPVYPTPIGPVDENDKLIPPPPPPPVQPRPDDQNVQQSPQTASIVNRNNVGNYQIQQNYNGGYDNSQQQPEEHQRRRPLLAESQTQRQNPSVRRQQSVGQFQPSQSVPSNVHAHQPELELQGKRPPLDGSSVMSSQRMQNPKSPINSNIQQPQRPPAFPQTAPKCSPYQWQCASGDQCVAVYDRCSGIVQCADGSDEQNCDQVANSGGDRAFYDSGANNNNRGASDASQSMSQQAPLQKQQNVAKWGETYNTASNYVPGSQQQNSVASQRIANDYGDNVRREQTESRNGFPVQPNRQVPATQRKELGGSGQQKKPQDKQPADGGPAVVLPETSAKKESSVEFISIQKLDSSATTNGRESASLAVVLLGLGMVMLAILLLYLSCRLRKVRRRLRRGKVLDTEEGEFLVNGMYL